MGLCQDLANPLGISASKSWLSLLYSCSHQMFQSRSNLSPQFLHKISASSSSEVPGGVSMIRASSSPQVTSVKNCLMRPFLKDWQHGRCDAKDVSGHRARQSVTKPKKCHVESMLIIILIIMLIIMFIHFSSRKWWLAVDSISPSPSPGVQLS